MQIGLYRKLRLKYFISEKRYNLEKFLPEGKKFYCSSARNGLMELIRPLPVKNVLLPAYVPQGIYVPFFREDYKLHYYDVNDDLTLNSKDIENFIIELNITALVVIHYFGYIQDFSSVKQICKKHKVLLIEDCAHVFPCKRSKELNVGSVGDISLFSFNKFLPLPDGAVLCINNTEITTDILYRNSFSNSLAVFLLTINMLMNTLIDNIGKLRHLKKHLIKLNSQIYEKYYHYVNLPKNPVRISRISRYLISRFNYEKLIDDYQQNILLIDKSLRESKLNVPGHYEFGMVLFCIPVIIGKRDDLIYELEKKGIRCTVLEKRWDYAFKNGLSNFPNAASFIKRHCLLPVSLFISQEEAKHIAESVSEIFKNNTNFTQR